MTKTNVSAKIEYRLVVEMSRIDKAKQEAMRSFKLKDEAGMNNALKDAKQGLEKAFECVRGAKVAYPKMPKLLETLPPMKSKKFPGTQEKTRRIEEQETKAKYLLMDMEEELQAGSKAIEELERIIAGQVEESELVKTTVERIGKRFRQVYSAAEGAVAQVAGQISLLMHDFEKSLSTDKPMSKDYVESQLGMHGEALKKNCSEAAKVSQKLREELRGVSREAQKFPGMEQTMEQIKSFLGAAQDLDKAAIKALTDLKEAGQKLKTLVVNN
jgi:uncharacterized phage infection (PIP) family protein YhgE